MSRRNRRLGALGLALLAVMAVGALPAAGAKKKPKTRTITTTVPGSFSQCQNLSVPLTDFSTNPVQFTVPSPPGADPAAGAVSTLASVAVRATHTNTEDIVLLLISPDGRVAALFLARGGGADLGSGATSCGGTLTTFAGITSPGITTGANPFAGTFRPETPLSRFDGGAASGIWTLLAIDDAAGDVGTLHAASLNLNFSHIVKRKVTKKKRKKKKQK
jgi:subtilisin-like proprotein convertase family protein